MGQLRRSISFFAMVFSPLAGAQNIATGILQALSDGELDLGLRYRYEIADEDAFVPRDASDQVREALQGHEMVIIHTYEGCDHGFARDSDAGHYNKDATELAHGRTFDLFKDALT